MMRGYIYIYITKVYHGQYNRDYQPQPRCIVNNPEEELGKFLNFNTIHGNTISPKELTWKIRGNG